MSFIQADRRGSERRVYLRHNDAISQLPKSDLRAPGEPAIQHFTVIHEVIVRLVTHGVGMQRLFKKRHPGIDVGKNIFFDFLVIYSCFQNHNGVCHIP